MKSVVVILLGLAALATAKSYEGYQVVSVTPHTQVQLDWLKEIRVRYNLDFWTEPRALGRSFDILLPPDLPNLAKDIKQRKISTALKIRDVQSIIDTQKNVNKKIPRVSRHMTKIDHTRYRTIEEIHGVLVDIASNSEYVTLKTAAKKTTEGRSFYIAEVSTDGGNSKPIIWIDCGIHAREWVAPATCQYILDVLTSGGNEAESLLSTHDFHILTNTNPDGYAFTWSSDRIWRKNRHSYGFCTGTDPNRNFDSDFGGPGTSDSPCSDIYHGEYAFSEIESQVVRDHLKSHSGRVKAYFTLHSYSQLWMTPYGYTYALPSNYAEQYRVAGAGVSALEAVHGKSFQYGNIAATIYEAAGGSSDWAYDGVGIQYAFAIELRDTGHYGFLLPANQIIPVGEETFAGIEAAINAMH